MLVEKEKMVECFPFTIHTSHSRSKGRLRFADEAFGATSPVGSFRIRRWWLGSANMAEKLLSMEYGMPT